MYAYTVGTLYLFAYRYSTHLSRALQYGRSRYPTAVGGLSADLVDGLGRRIRSVSSVPVELQLGGLLLGYPTTSGGAFAVRGGG